MDKILKINTALVFIMLMLPLVVADFIEDQFIHTLLYIFYYVAHFSYYLLTYDICSSKIKSKNSLGFLLSTFFLMVFFGAMTIIIQPGERIEFSGILGSLMTLAFTGSLSYCLYFISGLQIRYTLGNKKLDTFHYFINVILFFFLPFGVWILFPRLKKAYADQKLKDFT